MHQVLEMCNDIETDLFDIRDESELENMRTHFAF
jgi:hypothetical protein